MAAPTSPSSSLSRRRTVAITIAGTLTVSLIALAAVVDMTLEDFRLSGTQIGDVSDQDILTSPNCLGCHGPYDIENDPVSTWSGSLMAQAGRDPLFFAQMATAEQDVANVGNFCMRCHVPMSFVTGHAADSDGSSLDIIDRDGVSCHFCHSMVDPIYKPGISPPEDAAILAGLESIPAYYGNAMFVLDPTGTRRGPRSESVSIHEFIESPFHTTGEFCGTCHDVGNVATQRQPDGTYTYNAIDQATPDENPEHMFPLERTFTEWRLSAFANGGVDLAGRFGGNGVSVVSSCQDCHMPRGSGQACGWGPVRPDLARHDFAGAGAQVLDLIAELHKDDPEVDLDSIAAARAKAVSMLERAADLEVEQINGSLRVRVTNQSGHKIPTGHIEGRRIWVNVQFRDASGTLLREHGGYDLAEAHLDTESTEVYEMHVGLSPVAAAMTGYPAGPTGHMSLADTIVKDNRIPPRGFSNAVYADAGAPVVGTTTYADGQHWDDSYFAIPAGTASATAAIYYQNTPRDYIEHLKDGNHTNHWGDTLYDLWNTTGKGAPIEMAQVEAAVQPFASGDLSGDGLVSGADLAMLLQAWGQLDVAQDLDGDRRVGASDLAILLGSWSGG